MIVWLNGALLPGDQARIDPRDRGLLLGDGLFETVCVRSGRLRLWDAHLRRLSAGAESLGLPPPPAALELAIVSVLKANRLADAAARITLTRGPGPRGIAPPPIEGCAPTLLITAAPLSAASPRPVSLCIARTTCRNAQSPLSRLKTLNYLDGVLARREALARGFDDAVMLNTDGEVAEATAANLFIHSGDRWLTPPVESGALPGVVRAALVAAGFGEEAALTEHALLQADAMLLTNSLGVTPVCGIEGRPLPPQADAEACGLYDAL